MDVSASPILLCSLCCANTLGAAIRSPLIGEAQRIKKIRENFLWALRIRRASPIGAAKAPSFAFKRRERRSANNTFYIAPIQLALHCSSLICPEPTYKFGSTDRKWKYGKSKMKVNQNKKIMSSATILGLCLYPWIKTIFDPP